MYRKLKRKSLVLVMLIAIWVIVSFIHSYNISYDWAREDFGEVADWGDSYTESADVDFGNVSSGQIVNTSMVLNVTWHVDKPYRLMIKWGDLIGEVNPKLSSTSDRFYIALRDEWDRYKPLSNDWIIVHKAIRPDMEQITVFFQWRVNETLWDQRYSGEYEWKVEPFKTEDKYALEHVWDFHRFWITWIAIAFLPLSAYGLIALPRDILNLKEKT